MKFVFTHCFYEKFQAPNASEITAAIQEDLFSTPEVQQDWQNVCNLKTFDLDPEKYLPLIEPSLKIFLNGIGFKEFPQLTTFTPWANCYTRNCFQETHHHSAHDLVCVYFPRIEENYAKFYLYDRHGVEVSEAWKKLGKIESLYTPDIQSGDIMFFPGYMLHGVGCHRSDEVRTSFSMNFNFNL